MIKNYFKILWRNLVRNKAYAGINILGLTIGMAAAMLIIVWIQKELRVERFHEKGNRLYAMFNRDTDPSGNTFAWNATPKILGPTLMQEYPDVEATTRFNMYNFLFTYKDTKLKSSGATVDSTFLQMFSFPLLAGDKDQALAQRYNIVLTADFAKSLFGNEDPMGKIVKIDSTHQFTVTGILKDLPDYTLFNFKYLIPWDYLNVLGHNDNQWENNSIETYTLLKEGVSQHAFDEKIKNITIDHKKDDTMPLTTQVFTQNINQYYLYNNSVNGKMVAGNLTTVRMFGVIAGLILLIACINFMNLSTARSEKRAKEVGIRKVVGVTKKGLILQFIIESTLLSCLAFIIALLLTTVCLPWFAQVVNSKLHIPWQEPLFWIASLAFILFTGLLAGSYPAFYLSSFNPVKVLKGTFKANSALTPRKILVTFQFTFAIILIISTIIISNQIRYGMERDTGYDREQLIYIPNEGNIKKNFLSIKNELLSAGVITSVTFNHSPITQRWSDSWGFQWEGSTKADEKTLFLRLGSDADFVKTIGLKLVAGRDIDVYTYPTDSNAIILNETAVKKMRLTDPIGKQIHYIGNPKGVTIVGVIKDFISESPFQKDIEALMVTGVAHYSPSTLHLKLNKANSTRDNLNKIKQIFQKYNSEYPFEYKFVDESYAQKFQQTERTVKLVSFFTGLTIFISCLGLFGLASYMAESKTKEIGIRKVLGASVFNITKLLSREFILLVLLSFVIASPIAWYVMYQWLEGFSYKISVQWWVFLATVSIALLITLTTVSWQAIRAAMANPVKSLRNE